MKGVGSPLFLHSAQLSPSWSCLCSIAEIILLKITNDCPIVFPYFIVRYNTNRKLNKTKTSIIYHRKQPCTTFQEIEHCQLPISNPSCFLSITNAFLLPKDIYPYPLRLVFPAFQFFMDRIMCRPCHGIVSGSYHSTFWWRDSPMPLDAPIPLYVRNKFLHFHSFAGICTI